MTLATALCVLALLMQGIPGRPVPFRLEEACRVVQAAVVADHASWQSGPWAVRWCHRDEWTDSTWTCRTIPVLLREEGGAVECLSDPSLADEAGPLEALGAVGYAVESHGAGTVVLHLCPVTIVDDARRRVLARELYPLLPWQCGQ